MELIVFGILFLLGTCSAQIVQNGQCDSIPVVADFRITHFLGTWNVIETFSEFISEATCARFDWSRINLTLTYDVTNTQVEALALQQPLKGTVNDASTARMTLTIPGGTPPTIPYWILDTDHANYALAYSCLQINDTQRIVSSWKLSKNWALTAEENNKLNSVIETVSTLSQDLYKEVKQSDADCFYLPEVNENEPVIFRGQCQENITRMEDFDIQRYVGWWHQIESYPTGALGDCRNSHYTTTVTAGEFQVVDTVVNNNTAQRNTYTLNATREGQLIRRTSDDSEETWIVLATDYENYSLLYKCENVNSFQQRVWSAKHSKTGYITDDSLAAMAPIITEIKELDPRYYLQDDQSNSGCFYLPEVNENEPVIFRGQCEDSVARMVDFNMERYLGWWHQVENYPTGEEGTCRSSRYTTTATPGQFQVVDIVMNNNSAQHNTFTVSATLDGRLIRRSQDDEETWIVLATDYENYSLLYKCDNVDRFHRRVWSAKHSKTALITDESENAMAPIVAAIPEIDLQYYQEEDQTIDTCFYYPPPDGTPLILRGQCDRNIPVVSDFETERFSGVWYHTEKYPELWDVGTCAGVRYTVNTEEERIDVREWHVVDDELDEIEGYLTQRPSTNNAARFISRLPSRNPGDNPNITTITSYLDILRTDYTSYAITFTCVDLNAFEQRITVWKLSRGRTIPDAVVSDIDTLLDSRPELDQQYFVEIEQNDDCPASSFLVKSSIIVILVSGLLQLFL